MPCPMYPQNPTTVLSEHTEKGCLHWFDIQNNAGSPNIQKARPFIIISRNNPKSNRVIACPISGIEKYLERGTQQLKYPYHAPLYRNQHSFLDKDSIVLLDQAYTISKNALCQEWYIGRIIDCAEIDKAIMYNYDLFDSIKQVYIDLLSQFPQQYQSQFTRK